MVVSVDLVARMAIRFGPVEIFALVLFGLSTICGLAEKSLVRGMIAGVIGLLLMTIGLDEMDGVARMTFGWTPLLSGVDLLVAMVGLFAVPQVMQTLIDYRAGRALKLRAADVRAELPGLGILRKGFGLMCRCAGLGTGIGAIPGTGGPIAAFLAYDHARRFSPDKGKFGKGAVEGVIAPETATNAVTGGAMIPLLSLGIPGGPHIRLSHPTGKVNIKAAEYGAPVEWHQDWAAYPHTNDDLLSVGILVMCGVGTFAIRNSFLDIYMMTGVGLIGYLLTRARVPVTPIILGLVLGPTMEREFRTAMILSEGNYGTFFDSIPALIFYALTLAVISFHFIGQWRSARRTRQQTEA